MPCCANKQFRYSSIQTVSERWHLLNNLHNRIRIADSEVSLFCHSSLFLVPRLSLQFRALQLLNLLRSFLKINQLIPDCLPVMLYPVLKLVIDNEKRFRQDVRHIWPTYHIFKGNKHSKFSKTVLPYESTGFKFIPILESQHKNCLYL